MSSRNRLPILYALILITGIAAVFCKAFLVGNPFTWFLTSLGLQYLFAFAAIYELRSSQLLSTRRKSTWSSLLLVAPLVFGLYYLVSMRSGKVFFMQK